MAIHTATYAILEYHVYYIRNAKLRQVNILLLDLFVLVDNCLSSLFIYKPVDKYYSYVDKLLFTLLIF